MNELLQNNITLFEWIRKNQGFPYFIGRRINGQNAITHDEMSYISSNGAKVIPILTVVTEKSAKDNARIAVALLDDLGIERDTSYAKEQVYNIVNNRYLKHKPTIFTTNLSYSQIENCTESVEYQRIYSRIIEMCIPVMVLGEDYRKVIKEEKLKRNKERLLTGGERT